MGLILTKIGLKPKSCIFTNWHVISLILTKIGLKHQWGVSPSSLESRLILTKIGLKLLFEVFQILLRYRSLILTKIGLKLGCGVCGCGVFVVFDID